MLPIERGTLENALERKSSDSQLENALERSERSERVSSDTVMLPLITEFELRQLAAQMRHGVEVRDRRYHLQNFQACFVGQEAVDWLIETSNARDVRSAVFLGQRMAQAGLLHHVCDEHDFDNKYYFYRFNVDNVGEQTNCMAQFARAKQVAVAQVCDCARGVRGAINTALHFDLTDADKAREFLAKEGLETSEDQIHWIWRNAQRHRRYAIHVACVMVVMGAWNWADASFGARGDNFAWGDQWSLLLLVAPLAHLLNCFMTLREWSDWGSEPPKNTEGDGEEEMFARAWGRIHQRYLRYFKTAYICVLSTVTFFEITAYRSGIYADPEEPLCTKLMLSHTVSVTTCFLVLVYYSGSVPFARRIGTCGVPSLRACALFALILVLTSPRYISACMFCANSVGICD